jgi:hypothetical protein
VSDTIALMWDCDGLEAAELIEDIDKKRVWAMLQGQDPNKIRVANLMHWKLRAQANMQRHYEIYIISVEEGITIDDIREAFEASPQTMADTVRCIGHRFYSDRMDEEEVRIR